MAQLSKLLPNHVEKSQYVFENGVYIISHGIIPHTGDVVAFIEYFISSNTGYIAVSSIKFSIIKFSKYTVNIKVI